MSRTYFILYNLLIIILILTIDNCYAYRASAHKSINDYAIFSKLPAVSLYFKENLGYDDLEEKILGKTITNWFKDAGEQEDKPAWRTRHHFLDPVNNQGVLGSVFGVFQLSYPTVVWAQKGVGQQGWADGGAHSWQDAREYFYTALISDTKEVREQNLADSFRALGQVMHLLADMSVPEHTRDTSHIFTKTIEPWLEEVLNKDTTTHLYATYFSKMTNALNTPIVPGSSLLRQPGRYPDAPISIANLYDSETYTGTNPEVTTTGAIGLAEYTNANFFSMGTEFSKFNHPAIENTIEYEEVDPVTNERKIFVASTEVNHLAQANVFRKYLLDGVKNGYAIEDDKIRADYMEKLIPRAVGYAGALVDYFYRGNLNITASPIDITFSFIKVTIENSTPNETMGAGDVSLVIRYKALTETELGGGKYLLSNPSDSYTYKVITLPDKVDLNSAKTIIFNFSSSPLPMNFSDMTMQLVYKGKLGNEDNAVAVSKLEQINSIYTDFALSQPPSGVYAKTSDSSTSAAFNELRVAALSKAPGGLSGGVIELALEYRTAIGDQFQSVLVDTEPANAAGYVFRTPAKNAVNTLPQGVPVELVFDLPSLPVEATDVVINIVYTNANGTQSIGVRDISEPTPVDVFNNTNKVCINNQWYAAGSNEAIAAVGTDINGSPKGDIFRHNIGNIYYQAGPTGSTTINALPTSNNLVFAATIAPGQMQRLGYILTDYQLSYIVDEQATALDIRDGWTLTYDRTIHPGNGFVNQTDLGFSGMYTIQGKKMWGPAGIIYDNETYPLDNPDCSWDVLQ